MINKMVIFCPLELIVNHIRYLREFYNTWGGGAKYSIQTEAHSFKTIRVTALSFLVCIGFVAILRNPIR